MKNRNIVTKFIFTIMLIVSIYLYKLSTFGTDKVDFMCQKYIPNYKDKYDELIKNYGLMSEKYEYIPAQVRFISLSKINNLVMINKGKNDGVSENSFVVNEEGLVGIVKKTFAKKSLVRLIISNDTRISIETNECYGSLNISNNKKEISDLVNCSGVEIGDLVYTSKYNSSGSNILIGKIVNIKNDKLYIDFSFNPYKLKYVGVISDSIWFNFK